MPRSVAFLAFALAVASAQADINYSVTPKPADARYAVTIDVPTKGTETVVQMPRWAPGAYVLSVPGKAVTDLTAADDQGNKLTVTQVDDSTWKVSNPKGKVHFAYTVPSPLSDETMHLSGPSAYLYVVDRKQEKCHLQLNTPSDWQVAVGLDNEKGSKTAFVAKTYDVLADNPITMGHFIEDHYVSAGKDHTIAMRGAPKSLVDRAHLIKAAKFVSDTETDFFGGAPYNHYVWHFSVFERLDGAGGLEHLSSTQISLSSGVGPGAVGVLGHEFFHLWNVKRIRSSVLGPFDYTKLPKTGALWWLEGVTDYYAHGLLNRYGWFDGTEMRDQIAKNATAQRSHPERFQVSPYDASYRVGDASNGRGNSNGYLVSYYDTGFLVGLCLDIEILSQTDGKKSLDEVEKSLWKMCRNDKPGFQEGEIRNQCIKAGGEAMGTYYDSIVMKPGELPLETQLAKIGLQIGKVSEPFSDLGFTTATAPGTPGIAVGTVSSATNWPGLKPGDTILSVNGKATDQPSGREAGAAFRTATQDLKSGDSVTLKVRQGQEEKTLSATVQAGKRDVMKVTDLPNVTPQQRKLQKIWMAKYRH